MSKDEPRKVYADIIDMPYRKNPNRKQMSLYDRAAQFAPFAALSGYDDMVHEEARLTDKESELSDYEIDILNRKLGLINDVLDDDYVPEITVTYFVPDSRKAGGAYRSIAGAAKKIDEYLGILEMSNGITIPFDDILRISSSDDRRLPYGENL